MLLYRASQIPVRSAVLPRTSMLSQRAKARADARARASLPSSKVVCSVLFSLHFWLRRQVVINRQYIGKLSQRSYSRGLRREM
ncbi:hypothetical protein IE81DRAFT_320917 [Ceraceosorus guamensis]|uniref:Uncharacterized protein n=1 Tax=Ceraceosorus guamensis TaxID=1522189 RepID=A0A316W734_9BASI|nr:hypothetical protein IE81DRAFT_320917 [Ceraceosorus guamensis]PWN44938.1 hypothetical protein IE81DRAFT_320917 [Ceraceosorus guamensis]